MVKNLPAMQEFSSVQSLSCVWLFATPWTAACQASLSITNSRSLPKLMSTESVMPSNHLILYCPLLLLPSIFPSIRVFSNEELFLHWVAYWVPTNLGSSFSILFFAFSYCSWCSQDKNMEVVCHSLLQWTTFCQTSPPWPIRLGWPHTAWLSFIKLHKLWSVWSDWLVVCDCGFSVSALWCPRSVPTVLLGFLLPWTWGISARLLQQSTWTVITLSDYKSMFCLLPLGIWKVSSLEPLQQYCCENSYTSSSEVTDSFLLNSVIPVMLHKQVEQKKITTMKTLQSLRLSGSC